MATEVERLIVRLEATQRTFEKQMAKATQSANRSARQIEGRFAQMNKRVAGYGRQMFIGFTAGATAALAPIALVRRALDTIADTSKIGKVADKVGLATEELQQLRYVAELSGVQANQMDVAMQRFSRRVAEAASGSGELRKVLEANGVELRKADGTMRSQRDILRDYANLIKNAGSEQERLLLAFKAFDTEGAALVNLFKQGSDAIDTMAEKTEKAGGVIEDKLVRRAEELDDMLAEMWRNFDVNSSNAILSAIEYLGQFETKLSEIGNSGFFKWLAEKAGADSAVFVPGEGVFNPNSDEMSPSARIAQAFQGEITKADEELVAALKARYGEAADAAKGDDNPGTTIIPGSGSGSGSGKGGGKKRADDYERLAKRIADAAAATVVETEAQRQLNPLIDDYGYAVERARIQQDLLNAAKEQGKEITPALREQINQLAHQYATATVEAGKLAEEQGKIREKAEELAEFNKDLARGIIDGFIEGKNAADIFADALKKVGDRLINDVLDNIFKIQNAGGGGGGFFGFISNILGFGGGISSTAMSAVNAGAGGLYDKGGYTGPGGKYQPAGVVHKGEYVFSKAAVDRIGVGNLEAMHRNLKGYAEGGFVAPSAPVLRAAPAASSGATYAPQYNIDASGAEAGVETKISAALKEYDKGNYQRFLSNMGNARKRNAL